MKAVSGRLRLDLAQYRELEAFSAFASDLDKASKAQLDRGQRLVELLKQAQFAPYAVERQVVSIWAGTNGHVDIVPVGDVRRFETEFLDYISRSHQGIYDAIVQTGKLEDGTIEQLKAAVADFSKQFQISDGTPLIKDMPVAAMDKGAEGQEKIVAHRPPAAADKH